MSPIDYRALRADDVDAVFETARLAWQFTYATIFDPACIDQFVRTNYPPYRLRSLVPLVAAQRMLFDVALDNQRVIGFFNIGPTSRGAELFRIYLTPTHIGMGVVGFSSAAKSSCGHEASSPTTASFTRTTSLASASMCVNASGTSPAQIGRLSGAWRRPSLETIAPTCVPWGGLHLRARGGPALGMISPGGVSRQGDCPADTARPLPMSPDTSGRSQSTVGGGDRALKAIGRVTLR